MTPRHTWLPIIALLTLPCAANAWTWVPTTGVAGWYDEDLPGSSLAISPTLALDSPRASLVTSALLSTSEFSSPFRGGRLAGAWLWSPVARMPLELRVQATHRGGSADPERGLLRSEARLHFAAPRFGAWMALASERAHGLDGTLLDPLVGFGVWSRGHGLTLQLDLEQRAGLLPAGEPAPAPPDTGRSGGGGGGVGAGLGDRAVESRNEILRVALTTTRATLRWEGSRLALESVGGVTLSLIREPKRWAQATATYQLMPDMAAFATYGTRDPELYLIEPADAPRATMGFRLSHWRSPSQSSPLVARSGATGWKARRLDDGGAWVLEVRAPGARLVEVAGDFTGWEPLRLNPAGGDRWQTSVLLEPGVHHVNLRVDGGAWLPPPGAPTATDSYGGSTGVLAIE